MFPDLRQECLEKLVAIGFDGYAIGGLSIGEPLAIMHEMVRRIAPLLPKDKPRYLMGVGRPQDLIVGVAARPIQKSEYAVLEEKAAALILVVSKG